MGLIRDTRFKIIKKMVLMLALISSLLIPFEQMVFAAKFSMTKKKTVGANLKGESNKNNGFNEEIHLDLNFSKEKTPFKIQSDNSISDNDDSEQVSELPDFSHLNAAGGGGLTSTAGNFHGAWNASVDPRTGNASFSLTVASVLYDSGKARRDLTLSYSGGPSARGRDAFALGPHWGFNVGTEQASASEVAGHRTTDIATGSGHRFSMVSNRNSQGKAVWRPLHHKLGDIAFAGDTSDWTVSMATDTRERIVNGYVQWEQARDGRKLYFYYDRNGTGDSTRRLTYICGHRLTTKEQQGLHNACAGNGIWITYAGQSVTIHGNQDITLHRGENGGISNIQAITLPPLSSEDISNSRQKAMIRFEYDDRGKRPWMLSRVSYPTGKSKTFLYNDESNHPGAQIKGLPIGINGAHIPVVTEVITTSEGSGSTEPLTLREWYRYGEVDGHGQSHNYMGYQGAGSVVPGRDNLFDRADDYTYSVSRDNGLTTTTTYNKYHLPQLVEQRDNQQKNLLARNKQHYIPLKGTTFAQLPGNYSLPTGSSKMLYATTEKGQDKTVMPARIRQATRYDHNGQKLWEQDAYGRITMTQYCPPEGNARCPATDSRWPRFRPEKTVMIPATHLPDAGSLSFTMLAATEHADPEPAVITVFDYMALPAVTPEKKALNHSLETTVLIQTEGNQALDNQVLDNLTGENLTGENQTGENNHFWQVKTKTVGTLPLAAVAHLHPGDTLPEPSQGKVSTETRYRYNTQPHMEDYGQVNQVSVIKYKPEIPVIKGHTLLMAAVPHPAVPHAKVTFNVRHKIDRSAQTRTTVTTVASALQTVKDFQGIQPPHDIQNFSGAGGSISLGTTVYSLGTGAKIASEDTLKEVQTKWDYDHWRRPVRQTVTPASGGREQIRTWHYILTSEENAVVETVSGGQQFKKVFNAHDQLVSTWHRFAGQAATARIENRSAWIPDSGITYTAAGKPASKTVYHAGDPGADGSPGRTIGLTTTYGYDTLNREVWKKTPDGVVSVTVRNYPAMQLLSYKVTKEGLGPLLNVTESNLLGKPVARYLLPLYPGFKKRSQLLYSQDLQRRLQLVMNNLQPLTALQRHNNYGLLPLSGAGGLFDFVNAALKKQAWLTRTLWQYDGNGRRISQMQGNGALTRWVYRQGNLVATIAPDGRTIHDTFNVHGKKVSRCVQPAGSALCHVLGTRGFDIQGNMLWQADEYGQRLDYTRDNNGRMLSMKTPATDEAPAGHTFTYEYNALGMTRASVDGRPYVTHRYDPDTWKLTDTNDAISHLHYTYDKNTGAVIKITRSAALKEGGIIPLAGIDYPATVQAMTHDRYLKPLFVVDEAGNKYTSVHDKLGKIVQTKVQTGTIGGGYKHALSSAITLKFTTYDSLSRPATVINAQGIQRRFSYDAAGRLASTTDTLDGKELLQLSYTYDADTDNILTLTRKEGELAAIQSYTYDLQNNLSGFHCSAVNEVENNNSQTNVKSLELCPRDIDIKNSGLTTAPIITDQKYTFDQWNNIRQVVQKVSMGKRSIKKTTNYIYATQGSAVHPHAYNSNRLLSYRSRWEGQASSSSPAILTYDSAGRIIKDVDGNLLHYNAFGQQDGFTNTETGEVTAYIYDSEGHQIARQPFSAENRPLQSPLYMLYSGHAMTAKAQRDKNNRLHVSAEIGGMAHSEDGVITRWYLQNYKGDVLQSYNAQGQSLSNSVYSPYGMQYDRQNNALTGIPKALKNQLPWWQSHLPGFDGQVSDEATGYQFLGGGYRAYNPVYRQFMAKDSFSPFKKVNGYGFGDNNPIMNTDPTGHAPKWLGYAMGAMGIGMSIVMSVLLPVAGAAIGAGAGVTGGVIAMGVVGAAAGTASGSLQIASTKHPENRTLQKVSNGFGIAEGIAAMAMGGMAVAEGVGGVFTTAGAVAKLTSGLLITSGITGALAGATGGAASGIGEGMAFDSGLAAKSGLQSAMQYLGYISMGLMAVSTISGLAATGLSTHMLRKDQANETWVDPEEEVIPDPKSRIEEDSEDWYPEIREKYNKVKKDMKWGWNRRSGTTKDFEVAGRQAYNKAGKPINGEQAINTIQAMQLDKSNTSDAGLMRQLISTATEADLVRGMTNEGTIAFTNEIHEVARIHMSSTGSGDRGDILQTYLARHFITYGS